MRLRALTLVGASALAIASLAVALLALNYGCLAWFGVAMGVLIPGYAFSKAVLPGLGRPERLLCSIGISLVLDIVGGLVLNLTPWGLNSVSWAAWLSGVTLANCAVAALRQSPLPVPAAPVWTRHTWRRLPGLAVAAGITAAAIFTAQAAARQNEKPFTQLWAMPAVNDTTCSLQLGIRNEENERVPYALQVETEVEPADRRIEDWPRIEVNPGEQWTTQLSFANCPTRTVRVRLYRLDQPGDVYRLAQISPTEFGSSIVPQAKRP